MPTPTPQDRHHIRVFLNMVCMSGGRVRAVWVARKTGTEMYRGSPRASSREAADLALRYLARHPSLVDTTNPEVMASYRRDGTAAARAVRS